MQFHPLPIILFVSPLQWCTLWCARFILWLPNYNEWKDTDKVMAGIAHQMDKANLSKAYRLDELLFFTYLLLLTFFMGTAFLIEACSFTYDDHKVFITNSYFALKEKGFCRKAGHAVINRTLLFSSGVSQQLQYFHKSFLNKLQKKEAWIKSEAKAFRSPTRHVSIPRGGWSMTLWGNANVSL